MPCGGGDGLGPCVVYSSLDGMFGEFGFASNMLVWLLFGDVRTLVLTHTHWGNTRKCHTTVAPWDDRDRVRYSGLSCRDAIDKDGDSTLPVADARVACDRATLLVAEWTASTAYLVHAKLPDAKAFALRL